MAVPLQVHCHGLNMLKMLHQCLNGRHFATCLTRKHSLLHQQKIQSGNELVLMGAQSNALKFKLPKVKMCFRGLSSKFDTIPSTSLVGAVSSRLKYRPDIDIEQIRKDIRAEGGDPSTEATKRVKMIERKGYAEAISALSQEEKERLKVLKVEHSFLYTQGYYILSPDEMEDMHWLEAISIKSKSRRLKYYIFLSKKKKLKSTVKKKKEIPEEERRKRRLDSYEHGKIFQRIYDTSMKRYKNHNLANAMMFGPPLIFDLDFAQYMRPKDIESTTKQMTLCYSHNLNHETPFHLHFTNCSKDNLILRSFNLARCQTQGDNMDALYTSTEKSYLDLFDKDKLVYLSPDARHTIRRFNPDDVYIIGAYVDMTDPKPRTYAKAVKDGIRCARLPLNEYIGAIYGRKAFNLDLMMQIMLEFYSSKSWEKAFKNIPKRFLQDSWRNKMNKQQGRRNYY